MEIYERSNLTKAQLVFWLGQKLNPDVPQYNNAMGVIIPLALDVERFQGAFRKLIENSDALRTVVTSVEGVPHQRVLPEIDYKLEVLDFSDTSDPVTRFEDWAHERCHTLFNLGERLFDSALIRLADEKYAWYFCQHHITCDAFSILITLRYLEEYYGRTVDGTLGDAAAIPAFFDYVEHELSHRGTNADPRELAFWRSKLATQPDPMSFYGKPAMRTAATICHRRCDLGADRTARIRALALHEEIATKTPFAAIFNIFAAILATYLNRMSGIRDVSIGMPFHNRRPDVYKQTIGIFIVVLPLRVTIDDDDTMFTLVKKVAADASSSLRNSASYLHNLANTRSHGVMLNYLLWTVPDFRGASCEFRWFHSDYGADPLVINFYDCPDNGNLGITFDFNTALFDEEMQQLTINQVVRTIDCMLEDPSRPLNYVELLTDGLTHSDASIARSSMLTVEEVGLLLREWNATARAYPRDKTMPQVFQEQVARAPEAVALVCGTEMLTYGELNRRSNQVARYLAKRGAQPGETVAVCMDRSADSVTVILAILKAGCAYLPLDPDYPKRRIEQVLEDAKPRLLITAGELSRSLDGMHVPLLSLEEERDAVRVLPGENVEAPGTTGESLAYVIYTSGSSGGPKGVCVPHRAVLRLVLNTDYVSIEPRDRVAQASNMAFDAATFELWGALLNGACLVSIPRDVLLSPEDLKKRLEDGQIDAIFITTALLNRIASSRLPDAFRSVKTVMFGGETASPKWVRRILRAGPPKRLLHVYGPTEATTFATWHHVQEVPEADTTIPIGQPIANTTVYVLGSQMRLLPAGVPGELYLGGDGLAIGYLGDPELTNQRFVPNPFVPGERLYRTGDLVKRNRNGAIEFLGRLDEQVKIRGFRVELGEVESNIRSCTGVKDAAVVLQETTPETEKLVAYIVPQNGESPETDALRRDLATRLPAHMVPSLYVSLAELPLNANGKVNRNALRQPARSARDVPGAAQAPRDSLELELVHTWEHLLDVRPVGVTDNFFDLGGHSLAAIQLVDEIERRFGRHLTPARLLEAPTIEQLAGHLRSEDSIADSVVVPIRPKGSKPPFFCVHPAPGTVFCFAPIARHMDPDRPFYGLQSPAVNGVGRLFDTMEETATCYIEAMRGVRPEGPYYIGGHSSGGTIAFEMARQLKHEGHEVGVVILMDSFAPLPAPRDERLYNVLLDGGDDAMWLASIMIMVECFFSTHIELRYRELRKLEPDAQYAAVLEELKRVNFLAPSAGPGSIHGLVDNCRAGMKASMRYCPEPYAGRVAYLHTSGFLAVIPEDSFIPSVRQLWTMLKRDWRGIARGTPHLVRDMMITSARSGLLRRWMTDRTLGWRPYVKGPIDTRPVPGNHISMLADPDAAGVAAQIQSCLDAADAGAVAESIPPVEADAPV